MKLHLFGLAAVFYRAVGVILASDVVIGIDARGFLEALRFVGRAYRARGVVPSWVVGPAAACFRLGAMFFTRMFFPHTFVHHVSFASQPLGLQVDLRRHDRSAAALVPHGHRVLGTRRSLNLGKRSVSRAGY